MSAAGCRLSVNEPGYSQPAPPQDVSGADSDEPDDASHTQPPDHAGDDTGELEDAEGSDITGDTDAPSREDTCLIVLVSDYTSSAFISAVNLDDFSAERALVTAWHDSSLHVLNGTPVILNALGADNVQRLDPSSLSTVWQRSVGRRANPWSAAARNDDSMIVALYGEGALVELSFDEGEGSELLSAARVELSEWDPVDSNPEPSSLLSVGEHLLVMMQRLTRFECDDSMNGALLALRRDTLLPDQAIGDDGLIELSACSPITWALLDEQRLAVGLSGGYRVGSADADDGGIELIDLSSHTSSGLILTESDLGGRDVVKLAAGSDGRLWALLADADFNNSVHLITEDHGRWSVSEAWWQSDGAQAIIERAGMLIIGDSDPRDSGVVILDIEAGRGSPPLAVVGVGGPPREFGLLEHRCP